MRVKNHCFFLLSLYTSPVYSHLVPYFLLLWVVLPCFLFKDPRLKKKKKEKEPGLINYYDSSTT